MVGKHYLRVVADNIKYDLELRRKYTVLRGHSATGKTTLVQLISNKEQKGVILESDIQVIVLNDNWSVLDANKLANCLLIADENLVEIGLSNNTFTDWMKTIDAYFLLITRRNLSGVPISVKEIYEFYSEEVEHAGRIYTCNMLVSRFNESNSAIKPDLIITEDSKTGYQFFNAVFGDKCKCIGAGGKSKVANLIAKYDGLYNTICVIVDSAAFGDCIETVANVIASVKSDIYVLLPESFEYLLMSIKDLDIPAEVLEDTYDYCSADFLYSIFGVRVSKEVEESWERFFTKYLVQHTHGDKTLEYNKRTRLKPFYINHYKDVLSTLGELQL